MKTLSQHNFDKEFEQWYNTPSYMIDEGFMSWLRKIKTKFLKWLKGEEYNENTKWSFEKDSKSIDIKDTSLNKLLKSNSVLRDKFPISYELSNDSLIDKLANYVTNINRDRAIPSLILYATDVDDIIKILKKLNVNNASDVVSRAISNSNSKNIALIFNVEFAIKDYNDNSNYLRRIRQGILDMFPHINTIIFYAPKGTATINLVKKFLISENGSTTNDNKKINNKPYIFNKTTIKQADI